MSNRMKDIIPEVFAEVIDLLVKEDYIKLENYFLDGTKTCCPHRDRCVKPACLISTVNKRDILRRSLEDDGRTVFYSYWYCCWDNVWVFGVLAAALLVMPILLLFGLSADQAVSTSLMFTLGTSLYRGGDPYENGKM